ncbi:ATP-binding cassette domain-containing protein, partial [bacterium]|nr:ATP-binding cassette domain-containing protein [bacterium]
AGALSGGMKQKLALACTLIHTPQVLILDEPTFGVDPVSRREFWDILKDLREDGLAILVSTAYMDEAGLCDRVHLMHRGRVLGEGTPDEVRDTFPHRLLSIEGADLMDALHRLKDRLPAGRQVHRFGQSLHVTYDEEYEIAEIRGHLKGLRVELHDLKPSVEDVFVERMTREEAA